MSVSLEQSLLLLNQILESNVPSEELSLSDQLLISAAARHLERVCSEVGVPPEYVVAHQLASLFKIQELDPTVPSEEVPELSKEFLDPLDSGRLGEFAENPLDSFFNDLN